jgi:hypothetical protein
VLEATGVNAADLLTAMRHDTLDKQLHAINRHVGTTGVGDPEGITGCYHRRATAGLEGFEFWHWTKFHLSVEDAINIVLAGDEAFECEDDDDNCEAYDRHHDRLDAAEGIVRNYLLNLTTKWTARDVKLARLAVLRASNTEGAYKARDFEPIIENLSDLATAMLRGLEAAAA